MDSNHNLIHGQILRFILQKLISDERFQSLVEGDVHRQLPVQFVNAVVSTPSMSDEIQVEIMKVCGCDVIFICRAIVNAGQTDSTRCQIITDPTFNSLSL